MRLGLEAGDHTLDLAVEQAVTGVPVGAGQLVTDGVEKTVAPLRDRGLSVCQVNAMGFNALSSDRDRQAAQSEVLEKAIPLAAETGCPYISICGGNVHPSGFGAADLRNFQPEALDEVARALAPLLALAEQNGVFLTIEPYIKTAVCSPQAFLSLKEKAGSDALRVNLDVTSFYDLRDMFDPSATVETVCTKLAGHYGLGHIKGIVPAEGFHIHIGLGPLADDPTDWSQVLELATPHLPDDSWMILEHVMSEEEGRDSLARVRAAAEKAGVELG